MGALVKRRLPRLPLRLPVRLRVRLACLCACLCAFGGTVAVAQGSAEREGVTREGAAQEGWHPAPGPLMTRWAEDVSPERVHPEYPRPQMVRDAWRNLNGLWGLALLPEDAGRPETFDRTILVPFPVESALSGVMTEASGMGVWYRREFELPAAWSGSRILLHFGAVDWEATVWVNGRRVGRHRGGYDPFSFDVTDALEPGGPQELVVRAWDPTDAGTQPRGKQVREPEGIWYTAATGIWRTVWLEPVPSARIEDLRLEPGLSPDLSAGTLRVTALVEGADEAGEGAYRVEAALRADGATVAEAAGPPGAPLRLDVDAPRPWSPDDPFLYDLSVRLLRGGAVVDAVESYAGLREIALGEGPDGATRLFLNGRPLFQYGVLDQGYWPDGLYAAPTDEALRHDIELARSLGFNMIRKHVKVEPARWYYWADRLGMLVWQDVPSGDAFAPDGGPFEIERSEASAAQFELELERIVDALHDHPSVVTWVLFNEGWGQHDTARLTERLRELDPTRLVDSVSGWNDMGVGDVLDIHAYPGPAAPPPDPGRASVLGEFGGLGLALPGLTWQDRANWGYRQFEDPLTWFAAYEELLEGVRELQVSQGLAAAVYTQLTDVEIEVNGLATYDRRLVKMDPPSLSWAARGLHRPLPVPRALVPTSEEEGTVWRYTVRPPGEGWSLPGFDDTGWSEGPGGFGRPDSPGAVVRTEWTAPEIWLRTEFTLDDAFVQAPFLRVHHDEDARIYLNGHPIADLPYYTLDYVDIDLDEQARSLLRPGVNTLAVHCRELAFGQYCDVGLYALARSLGAP